MVKRVPKCEKCGAPLKKKRRSNPHLNRYMAVCTEAFKHWPSNHEFQPKNKDHLRYWLEVTAEHFEVVKTIRCESANPEMLTALLTAVMRTSEDDKQFVEASGNRVVVKRAISVDFETLEHLPACHVFNKVEEIIECIIGVSTEQLLIEKEGAA